MEMQIGKLAAKKIFKIEPENAGTYSLLSNIRFSREMERSCVCKDENEGQGVRDNMVICLVVVGWSNRVEVYVVGDMSHSQSEIDYLLLDLPAEMKKAGGHVR